MKSIVKSTLAAMVVALACAATPAWAEIKIGVVDYGKLMEESPQAKAALEAIRTEFTPRQRELQTQQARSKARKTSSRRTVRR